MVKPSNQKDANPLIQPSRGFNPSLREFQNWRGYREKRIDLKIWFFILICEEEDVFGGFSGGK
ncbi:hypothetical protein AKJ65_06025 [candidate division MSBL1 archaeon SCGC-AAA259E19]|uniref:Uncharacterized protein n=2 Tax=candidate division MSBL1 TaxID=215777 RepID=A0A133V432_9EURY|nr:hypothetical protein AKJ65_06025 [candidate division MSBL1 archaeon SCGC-AAA259E19]KXB01193.1 hypothetical protein AKJ41_02430 [candidate division MSBL1 archaeon SCGC-AAA259O05]